MSPVTAPAMRPFFLGMLIWTLPGVIPPFLGSDFVVNIASWLCRIAAVVCFFLAYRKASASH